MKSILSIALLFSATISTAQDYKSFPMWNYNLPFEQRVNDVVSRLTLEEKVQQMLNATPAIPRLGILAYDWWNETLHGVARTPYPATSYPQAIAMAATWDSNSLYRMADYSAMEGRAIQNLAIKEGKTKDRYLGLTYWTPNINIFRDPRWGRGQETYGEDPFLTAMMGRAFVRGLQGEDPKYLKAAACAKHYAVHSGPEPSRHSDNFNPSAYDLWDTYLPAFKELITKANVAGVMCAYNAVNTQPCCANDFLMNDILRRQWKFTGYVTSDCWAIDDFFKYHKTHKDAVTAAVDAVMHGTDIECGVSVYLTLLNAVKDGLIPEAQIDASLRRLFTIRYRLGMFDPPSMVKYTNAPETTLEAPEHKALALKMAQQSIVLLKNANNTLPLRKTIKKIAIVGPNADNRVAVLGNYNGMPSEIVTVLDGIKAKLGNSVQIQYEKGSTFTNDTLVVYTDVSKQFTWEGKQGFKAEYFNNMELKGEPVAVRTENSIDHFWQEGETVTGNLVATNFSARYATNYTATTDGSITFETEGDDAYKLLINDKEAINVWTRNRMGARTYKLKTQKDSVYKMVLEYWQGAGKGEIRLRTGNFEPTDFAALVNSIKDADAIVYVGGISPQLEGEEMPVNAPGFNGGDRTTIALPAVQTQMMKALQTTGKPVVFVMMTGSAIAIPWEDENLPAIVNAWYGGQSAGTAVADVLFGDYNPAGRLPVTFYKSDSDLPGFSDYDMKGRTYRYFRGDALFPFGYGLSYTTFNYSNFRLPLTVTKGKNTTLTVQVTNTGKMKGEEVVQLYVSSQNKNIQAPIRALKGFQRIELKAGETKTVKFTLTSTDLSLVNKEGKLYQPEGKIMISVGGGQPGIKNKSSSNVLSKTIIIK
ncbi:MAG TPA: glycoside hydrolase family 3 C-terminal domain-containing protein [Ferruginibacter sp.]|nr:glycoside hydrolase family 3 C-terminal domain-containing protein [Ferruginibacter sp.]HPH89355.1 glycoside hydrolase family 3 C-terminal domain-containing protein [Ferruginibacter sp.]